MNIAFFIILKLQYYTHIEAIKDTDAMSYLFEMKAIKYHEPHSDIRPFGYPLIILLADFFSANITQLLWVLYGIQCILFVGMLILLATILSDFITTKWVNILLLVVACNPSYITYCFLPFTEISFAFFLMASLYYLLQFLQHKHTKYLPHFIFLVCYAALIRPGFFYLTILAIVCTVYYCIIHKKYVTTIITILLVGITIGVQLYIMHKEHGVFKISTIGTVACSRYLNTSVIAQVENKGALDVMLQRDSLHNNHLLKPNYTLQQYIAETKKETIDLLNHHPMAFLKAYASHLFGNTHTNNKFSIRQETQSIYLVRKLSDLTRIWNMIFVILLLGSTGYTIRLYLKQKNSFFTSTASVYASIGLVICNYIFFTSGVSYFQGDRFHIVFFSVLVIAIMCITKIPKTTTSRKL